MRYSTYRALPPEALYELLASSVRIYWWLMRQKQIIFQTETTPLVFHTAIIDLFISNFFKPLKKNIPHGIASRPNSFSQQDKTFTNPSIGYFHLGSNYPGAGIIKQYQTNKRQTSNL